MTDYIRRYYKKQEIDSYLYDFTVTSSNDTEEKIIADDLMAMERTRLAAMPEQRRLIYTLNRFEDKSSPEIASELELSCRTVENHLFSDAVICVTSSETVYKIIHIINNLWCLWKRNQY